MALTNRYGFTNAPTSAIIGDSSLAWTTATGALTAAGTALTVASSSAFPSALEFDIVIGLRDTTTGIWSNAEVRHVTVVSGTTWTVSAGSLNHASGESISLTLTAEGLKHNPGALTDTGDMPYLLSTGRMGRLAAPADGTYSVAWLSGVPTWTAAGSGGISFADLATPPGGTALGSSGAPYSGIFAGNGSDSSLSFNSLAAGGDAQSLKLHSSTGGFTAGPYIEIRSLAADATGEPTLDILGSVDGHFVSLRYTDTGYAPGGDLIDEPDMGFLLSGPGATNGIALVGSNGPIRLAAGGFAEANEYLRVAASGVIGIGPFPSLATMDVGIYRNGSGVLEVNTGTAGVYAGLKASTGVFSSTVTATDFIVSGSRFKSDTTDGHTAGLAGYDVDGTTYRDILTWTNGNAVAAVLATPTGGTLSGEFSTLTLNSAAVATQSYVGSQGFTTLAAVAGVGYLTSVTAHNVLSATHGDALADTVVRGDIIYGNSTPKWARLAKPSVLSGLSHDGTDVSWVTATGTGAPVRAASPTLTTPALGTPSALVLTNATGLPEGGLSLTDITTANVSSTAHGFAPKFPNNTTTFLRGDGTYAAPAASGVTSIATTSPISGGTITSTGTISLLVNTDFLFTASQSITKTVNATSADGFVLTNTTSAANNAQQWSPRLRLTGQGWDTAATKTVDWVMENVPVQASTNPTTNLVFSSQVNAGGYTSRATLSSSGRLTVPGETYPCGAGIALTSNNALLLTDTGLLTFGASIDVILRRGGAAATLQMGSDANGAAVSQTIQGPNGITGTDRTPGNLTIRPGAGTGAGAAGSLIVQSPTVGVSGTTAQTQATRLTINSAGVKCSAPLWLDNAAATGLAAGVLAATTNATIVIYDSAGQAYRVPCII